MAINIETIATAAITALLTSGVVIFAAKRFIGGMIDSHIKRADEEHMLRVNEEYRRRKELYDRQAEVLEALTASIYRLRDAAHGVEDGNYRPNFGSAEKKLRAIVQTFEENLFTSRAVVPPSIFAVMHEIRPPISALLYNLETLKRAAPAERDAIQRSIEQCVNRIDAIYQAVIQLVHEHRGVDA